MQDNKLHYHFNQFLNEFKAQIAEEVATSVIQVLSEQTELNKSRSQDDVYLTSDEVASLFKISKSQLVKLRKKYKDFPVIKIESTVRFKQSELEVFFENLKNRKHGKSRR